MPLSDKTARPPLVLIANDQEWFARSLESILGPSGFAVLRAFDGPQTLEFARAAQPDAIIVDHSIDDRQALELVQQLRADPHVGPQTPILLTASAPLEWDRCVEAYRAGVWDVCAPPLNADLLLLRLRTFIDAKRAVDRIRDESLLDATTGLYNMRGLARRAREIGAEAQRQHDALACVAFTTDADPAPQAASGESSARVAEHLSAVLRRTGRGSDAFGRVGQGEFAIIAPATQEAGAVRLVERLQDALADAPLDDGRVQRRLTIRAGFCAVPDFADASVDAVEMLLRAAAALRKTRDGATDTPGELRAFRAQPPRLVQ